jgi:PAS domain S-box-containing protein
MLSQQITFRSWNQIDAYLRETETRYRALVASIDQAFCVVEMLFDDFERPVDYRFLEVNPVFEKLTGISTVQAAEGRTARVLIENLEEKSLARYGRVATTGAPARFVERSIVPARRFDVFAFRIGGPESRRVGIFYDDTTEYERAERSLAESEKKYRILIEQASDGIHTYDLAGNFIETNSKLCEMLGYAPEELLRLNVRDLVPPEDLIANPIRFDELNAGRSVINERRLLRKDGTLLPVEISGKMIEDGLLQAIIRDITERQNAEARLRQSEERLRTIFETSADGILVEENERIVYVNNSYIRLFGYDRADELVGRHISTVISDRDARRLMEFGRGRLAAQNPPSKYEFKGRRKDSTLVDVEASVSTSKVGGAVYITTIIRDISERKRAEAALMTASKRLRLITDAVPMLISFVEKEHRYRFVNRSYTEWFGKSYEEIVGKHLSEVLGPATYENIRPEVERALAGETLSFERMVPYKDSERFISVNYIPEIDPATGQASGFYAFVRDITKAKQAEEELRRSHEELELRVQNRTRELEAVNEERVEALRQLVTVQEDERQRIARDLHDQLGQQLTALRLKLEMLKKNCAGREDLSRQVGEVQTLARELDSDVDFLAWQLRPTTLDELGLVAALDNYVRQWSTHFNIPAEFNADRFGRTQLSCEAATNFYRIAQEALNNIGKYARATRVNVFLEPRDAFAVLIIEDDGVGFDPGGAQNGGKGRKGMGIIGMRERAALVGGILEIESAGGIGTTVYVSVPVLDGKGEKDQ